MSLTIDGKHISELNLSLLREHQNPAAPATRDNTITIPGMHGAYDFGATLGPREFSLPLHVKLKKETDSLPEAIRKMVMAFIDPYGKPKTVKLIFDYEPDKYYLARYSGSIPIDRYFSMGKFELPLTAYDPHAYSVFDTSGDVLWGDDIPFMSDIPFGIGDFSYEVTTPTTVQIENVGSLVVRPIITITGSASSMTLTTNGKSFSVGPFPEGANLLIDSQHYVVTRDGQNYISKMTGDFLELLPGENSISITGTNLHFQISFEFNAKYM
ncbi:phage tail family protein [Bacillus pfraonensis]|uniref:distal tail protein Dit n=1 Tax=Bacillus pfraonensis TaxID=2830844 RepID=UPI003D6F1355